MILQTIYVVNENNIYLIEYYFSYIFLYSHEDNDFDIKFIKTDSYNKEEMLNYLLNYLIREDF